MWFVKVENCSESEELRDSDYQYDVLITIPLTAIMMLNITTFIVNLIAITWCRSVRAYSVHHVLIFWVIMCNLILKLTDSFDSFIHIAAFLKVRTSLMFSKVISWTHTFLTPPNYVSRSMVLFLAMLMTIKHSVLLINPYRNFNYVMVYRLIVAALLMNVPASIAGAYLMLVKFCVDFGHPILKRRKNTAVHYYFGIYTLSYNVFGSGFLLVSTIMIRRILKRIAKRSKLQFSLVEIRGGDHAIKEFYKLILKLNVTFLVSGAVSVMDGYTYLVSIEYNAILMLLFFMIRSLTSCLFALFFVVAYFNVDKKFRKMVKSSSLKSSLDKGSSVFQRLKESLKTRNLFALFRTPDAHKELRQNSSSSSSTFEFDSSYFIFGD